MNPAEVATQLLIEETLKHSSAFRKIDDRLYVVKQGSAFVMINVVPWGENKCMVRVASQLVKGIDLNIDLATQLMKLNGTLRFGAFAYDGDHKLILFLHSILGGHTLDADELVATVSDVALIADEYDDRIVKKYGGQTMRDLVEEAAFDSIIDGDPSKFDWKKA